MSSMRHFGGSSGSETRSLSVGDQVRTYHLHRPASVTEESSRPLVLVFHGGTGNGARVAWLTGFDALADRDGMVMAYPDAYAGHWNDGRGTGKAAEEGIDDVAFVRVLIQALQREFDVDPERIYAVGVSNGAVLVHRLGCEMSEQFTAIATVSGSMAEPLIETCAPPRPISVMMISGTGDPWMPWSGGEVSVGVGGRVAGAEATMEMLAQRYGCNPAGEREVVSVSDQGKTRIWKQAYESLPPGPRLVLYGIDGGGHAWPPRRALAGETSKELNATELIWDFFFRHSSDGTLAPSKSE
jgi:polyhydroxybutyrate depolymerase